MDEQKKRRDFLKATAGVSLALGTQVGAQSPTKESDKFGDILPRRPLGKTGLNPTVYCVGGAHISRKEPKEAQAVIDRAIERGVRFFDTAVAYKNGKSEEYYGQFLTPKYREHIHLFSKTQAKTAKQAREHVEGSLRRMKTDYLDLYLVHSVESIDDVNRRWAGGAWDELLKLKAEGKIKHLGFSGHRNYEAHLHLLRKDEQQLEFCLMPFNVADPSYRSFITNTVPLLKERKMGLLGMKTLAGSGFFGVHPFKDNSVVESSIIPAKISVAEALSFALTGPVTAIVNGVDDVKQLDENIDTVLNHKQLTEAERQALVDRCAEEGKTGTMEYFKEKV